MVSTTPIRSMTHSRARGPLACPPRRRPESGGDQPPSDPAPDPASTPAVWPRLLGRAGRRRRLARLHPDGGLRRQRPARHRAGRGPGADRRRRHPLPRCDLVPLGQHPRPPRPRARPGPRRPSRPRSPTRPCWATGTRSSSSWPRHSPRSFPSTSPHFLFAADGAVAVEQALKIAFQYWVNRGPRRTGPDTGPLATPHAAFPLPRPRRRLPRRHHRLALPR